jgi:hypothetical protein
MAFVQKKLAFLSKLAGHHFTVNNREMQKQ